MRRENGFSQPQPSERDQHDAEVRASLQRRVADYYAQAQDAVVRSDERAKIYERALTLQHQPQPQPQEQDHAWSKPQERPDPNIDIFQTMEWDRQETQRLHDRLDARERQEAHYQRELAERQHVEQSMAREAAADREFSPAMQQMLYHRKVELVMRHHYPDATHTHVHHWAQTGQLPQHVVQDVNRRVEAEIAQECKNAIAAGRDPAQHFRSLLVGRMGYKTQQQRAWEDEQRQKAQERQRAAARQHEQSEDDWFERTARRVAASSGVSQEESLRDVLPRREDRQRYYEIRARRREQSWPGSGYSQRSGATTYNS